MLWVLIILTNLDTFAFVGVAITVCEGIVTILPIRDSMVNKLVYLYIK